MIRTHNIGCGSQIAIPRVKPMKSHFFLTLGSRSADARGEKNLFFFSTWTRYIRFYLEMKSAIAIMVRR